jgi:hypothetical protein
MACLGFIANGFTNGSPVQKRLDEKLTSAVCPDARAASITPVTVTDAQTRSRQTCALGIIGTGMLAVPVLAGSAAYAFQEARGFYLIIVAATILGTVVGAFEVVMLWIGQSRRLMGAPTISRRHRFFGW